MSGSCREFLLKVQETLPDEPEWWEALPDVREWSKGYSKCPQVVGRPSRMSRSGREALPDVREWL